MGVVGALARNLGIEDHNANHRSEKGSKAWARRVGRYYGSEGHAHICRACLWQILLHLLTLGKWESRRVELHHRTYRYKWGQEPSKAFCPLCDDHHAESDALRRMLEAMQGGGQWGPMITAHRIYLVTQYIEQLVVGTFVAAIGLGVLWVLHFGLGVI